MTGFTAYLGSEQLDLRKGGPVESDLFLEATLSGGQIALWGGAVGDVHFIQDTDNSSLTLVGSVDEIEGWVGAGTHREICSYLIKEIGNCESLAEIGALALRFKGSFALFHRNARNGSTVCISDRLASRPLWTGRTNGGWIISSHVMAAALSAGITQFSPAGLGAFLLYAGPIDPTRSLFEGLTAVPAGSVVRLLPSGQTDCLRWYQFRHQPDVEMSYSEWVDLISDRLVRAAQRNMRHCHQPAVFFSGGTDSRLMAAAMKAAGSSPVLLTLSDGPNIETRVAIKAARALGLEHRVITRDPHWYLRSLRRAVYETGGIYLWTHGHFAAAAREAATRFGVDAFVLGDFCEAFSKLFCATDRRTGSLWSVAEFLEAHDSIRLPLYRPQSREQTLTVLNQRIRRDVDQMLREQIVRRYEHLRTLAEDPKIVGDLAFRWESVGLLPTFFMFQDLRSAATERNIMFDPDVQSLLERLPSTMRDGRNLGAQVIKRLCPRAAWVVNSNSLVPMFWPPVLHKTAKQVKPWLGKARRAIQGRTHRTTGSWQERAPLYCADPQWRALVESVLERLDRFDGDLFDRDRVRGVCQSLLEGDLSTAGMFEKLVQLEMLGELLHERRSPGLSDDSVYSLSSIGQGQPL